MKMVESKSLYIRTVKARQIITLDMIKKNMSNPIIHDGLVTNNVIGVSQQEITVRGKKKAKIYSIHDDMELKKYVGKDKKDKRVKKLKEVGYEFLLDNSLESEKLFDEYDIDTNDFKLIGFDVHEKTYQYECNIFVNVEFSNKNILYKNSKDNESTLKVLDSLVLRDYLYENGFKIGHDKYRVYKRSSNKSRGGSCLFVLESYYDMLMDYSYINKFNDIKEMKNIPLDKCRSYDSLTMSGIIGTLDIKPSEILMINDKFTESVHRVGLYGKNNDFSKVGTTDHKIICNLWDGQCLISDKLIGESSALLRERWFKSNAIATDFEGYFSSVGVKELVDDFTGEIIPVSDLKLIITPSSLKWLSLTDTVFNRSKEECYKYWKSNLIGKFGICKYDKGFEQSSENLMNYQYLSSLNLSTEQLNELLSCYEYPKINELKNDLEKFREYVSLDDSSPTRMMIKEFSKIEGFEHSQLFREFRNKTIESYIKRLKRGRIGANGKWLVLCGNVLEMLEYTHNKDVECKMGADDCFTTGLQFGEKVALFRSPHILSSNCLVLNNVRPYDEDKEKNPYKWFKFNEDNSSIIVLNSWGTLQFEALNNADMDSDFAYSTTNKIIVDEASKYYKNPQFPIPISGFVFNPIERNYTPLHMANLDDSICNNCIGDIVNLSAFLQAVYFDKLNNGADKTELKGIFDGLIKLSILSQLEIDKSKKSVDSNQIAQTLKELTEKYKGKDDEVKEPLFAQYVKNVKEVNKVNKEENYTYTDKLGNVKKELNTRKYNCTMDNLLDALSTSKPRKTQDRETFDLLEVLPKPNTPSINYTKLNVAKDSMVKLSKITTKLNMNNNNKDEKELKKIKKYYQRKLRKDMPKDLNHDTLLRLIRLCLGEDKENELYQHRQTILGLLYMVYNNEFKGIIQTAVNCYIPLKKKTENVGTDLANAEISMSA